jgi:hypothetical protein
MGKKHAVKIFTAVCVAVALLVTAGSAQAGVFKGLPEVIVLQPGHDQTRQFYLNDTFDLDGFNNYESYLFVAVGDNSTKPATKPGVLTITLSTSATITFGSYIDYSLLGFSYPIGGKLAANSFYSLNYTTPQKATKAITLNAMYGFGFVAAYMKNIEGVVTQPTPFTIVFSLAAKK